MKILHHYQHLLWSIILARGRVLANDHVHYIPSLGATTDGQVDPLTAPDTNTNTDNNDANDSKLVGLATTATGSLSYTYTYPTIPFDVSPDDADAAIRLIRDAALANDRDLLLHEVPPHREVLPDSSDSDEEQGPDDHDHWLAAATLNNETHSSSMSMPMMKEDSVVSSRRRLLGHKESRQNRRYKSKIDASPIDPTDEDEDELDVSALSPVTATYDYF